MYTRLLRNTGHALRISSVCVPLLSSFTTLQIYFVIFPKYLFLMNSTMQRNVTFQITHKLFLSYTKIYKTAPLLFCSHKWEFFIFCVSCPHHLCFIPALKMIASSKDLFPTSMTFKGNKRAPSTKSFSAERTSHLLLKFCPISDFIMKYPLFQENKKLFRTTYGLSQKVYFPKQKEFNSLTRIRIWQVCSCENGLEVKTLVSSGFF